MFSKTTHSRVRALSEMPEPSPCFFELGALFGRVERFEARRNRRPAGAVTSSAARLDVQLLDDGALFEAAWAEEVAALIALKRINTSQAECAARCARAATERLAARIEASRASTLDGLKVKARAILWRRNGEPLETFGPPFPASRENGPPAEPRLPVDA
jgi:hypothetical protein